MRKQFGVGLMALAFTVTVFACAADKGPPSPYMARYANLDSSSVRVPEVGAIQDGGTFWTIERPPHEVWNACLEILSQYEAIVAIDDRRESKTAVAVHGQEMPMQASRMRRNTGMSYTKFVDVWLAVNAYPEADGQSTTVSVAAVVPDSGKIAALPNHEAVLHPDASMITSATDHRRLQLPTGFEELDATVARARPKALQLVAGTDTPDERRAALPNTLINEFYYQLAIHLFAAERWDAKFGFGQMPPLTPRNAVGIKQNSDYNEYAQFETDTGTWASARLRRMFVALDRPQLSEPLQDVAQHLVTASQSNLKQIKVHILVTPEPNAFALPNGDIFVFSGLLDTIDTTDELAAVMAHEIDHVANHDTVGRLVTMKNTQNAMTALMVVVSLASAGAGAAVAPAAGSAANAAASSTANLTSTLVESSIKLAANTAGQVIANSAVNGHSEEAELRADSNGATYMWAAGYDVNGNITMLEQLEQLRVQATGRNELISSGLVNAKPGLTKRLAALKSTVQKVSGQVAQ